MSANLADATRLWLNIVDDNKTISAFASGTINVGDFLIWSGSAVVPTAVAAAGARVGRASAAGIALESNPRYVAHGGTANNDSLVVLARGRIRASAADNLTAIGNVTYGTPVYPSTTGSGVASPTALSGVAGQWSTAAPVLVSSNPSGAGSLAAYGRVVNVASFGAASGQTQLDIDVDFASTPVFL
jgi:hypothetical protein